MVLELPHYIFDLERSKVKVKDAKNRENAEIVFGCNCAANGPTYFNCRPRCSSIA